MIRASRILPPDPQITPRSDASHIVDLPAYAQPIFDPYRYKVLWGGRGAARSWTIARALLITAAQNPLRILCTREMQSSLRDSVHQLLRDQIDALEIPGYRVTDREIRHRNGSLFLFEGLRHNVTKIKSLEGIDRCWVEEAERVPHESWQVLIPTIRKTGSEIWVSFNPDQESDSTYQRFITRTPKHSWILKVSWEDNPWLSEELREEKDYAYTVDAEAADHVWGGNLRQVSDAQILRGKWFVEEFVVPRDEDGHPKWNGPYQGEDFGFATDPHAGIRCWVDTNPKLGDTLYVEHESFRLHLELDETSDRVCEDIPDFDRYVTRADSARPDSISYLRRHGLPKIKPVKKHPNSVEDGIAHLRSYRRIVLHARCTRTRDECKRYSYKVDARSGDVLPIIVDAHNHLIDSLRYALEPLIKPRRKAGFLFASDGQTRPLCPDCASFLPDDGICPHCGWTPIPAVDDPFDSVPVPVIEMVTDVPRIDTRHPNGNGASEHGRSPLPRRSTLRGIND